MRCEGTEKLFNCAADGIQRLKHHAVTRFIRKLGQPLTMVLKMRYRYARQPNRLEISLKKSDRNALVTSRDLC